MSAFPPQTTNADRLVQRLRSIVGFDTQNPTGNELPLAEFLVKELQALGASHTEILRVGKQASAFARFGTAQPRLLFNAHLDTVPANSGYDTPPLSLVDKDGRLFGLGTSDIKGAIAAILEALAMVKAQGVSLDGIAVLFSGDEEHGGTCMRDFVSTTHGKALGAAKAQAIVCEPTNLRVGRRHRGIVSGEATVTSPGGHSSRVDQIPSPIAQLARAAVALDELGARLRHQGPPGFEGICMNIAALNGGVAFNVIPGRATLQFCFRPAPTTDVAALLAEVEATVRKATLADVAYRLDHTNPPFATRDLAAFAPLVGDAVTTAVDLGFWTEAALLVEAGLDAVVCGPGDIKHAHAANESITVAELVSAAQVYARAMTAS